MAEMEAVKVADGHGGRAGTEAGVVEAAVYDHPPTSSRRRPS
jgi:hypothetical protein